MKLGGEAQGRPFHPGATGKGKAGRVNESEPLLTSRQGEPRKMELVPGCRAGQCEMAGGDRWHLAGRGNTAAPGYRRHPPRPGLTHVERGNPVLIRAFSGGLTVRKAEHGGGNRMAQEA